MLRSIFQGAADLAFYPVLSLIIFLGIFISVLVWLTIIRKPYIKHMSHLPLEEPLSEE